MIVPNYSPQENPAPMQQRDALAKGMGRAVQWATTGELDDPELLNACQHDLRFDKQIDEPRAEWLWRVLNAAAKVESMRNDILQSLYLFPDEYAAAQLCGLALQYAKRSDDVFRNRLYEIVETKPDADWKWLGEEEVISLDGVKGFQFVARVRGSMLADEEWDWNYGGVIYAANERLGEEGAKQALENSSDPAIRCFLDGWKQAERAKESGKESSEAREAKIAAMTSSDVISAAEKGERGQLRSWGRQAKPDELQRVVDSLFATKDVKQQVVLLQVFSRVPLPTFDERLFDLCRSEDEALQRHAFNALAQNSHPAVRSFALHEMANELSEHFIAALFERNYQPGDERLLLERLSLPDDSCELHWLLMDLLDILEANGAADASQLALIAYGATPCEMCCHKAARLLFQRANPPKWLLEEYRHDAYEEAGKLLAEYGFPSGTNSG